MDSLIDLERVVHVFIYKYLITRALQIGVWTAFWHYLLRLIKGSAFEPL